MLSLVGQDIYLIPSDICLLYRIVLDVAERVDCIVDCVVDCVADCDVNRSQSGREYLVSSLLSS